MRNGNGASAAVVDDVATRGKQRRAAKSLRTRDTYRVKRGKKQARRTEEKGAADLGVLAGEIRQAHDALLDLQGKTVEKIFALGDKLVAAKDAVKKARGKWTEFKLPFDHDTASAYIKVARAEHLRNPEISRLLPSHLWTLYALAMLRPAELEAYIKQGRVKPDMNGESARAMRQQAGQRRQTARGGRPGGGAEAGRCRLVAGALMEWAMGPGIMMGRDAWLTRVCKTLRIGAGDDNGVRRLAAGLRELAAMLEDAVAAPDEMRT
jgi:hypothetical protein